MWKENEQPRCIHFVNLLPSIFPVNGVQLQSLSGQDYLRILQNCVHIIDSHTDVNEKLEQSENPLNKATRYWYFNLFRISNHLNSFTYSMVILKNKKELKSNSPVHHLQHNWVCNVQYLQMNMISQRCLTYITYKCWLPFEYLKWG